MARDGRIAAIAALLACSGAACSSPTKDYDNFVARRGDAGVDDTEVMSTLQDLNGDWLVNALLAGGLQLGLRMRFQMDLTKKPIPLHATIWLAASDPKTTMPLIETDTTVNSDGTFVLVADPLILGPETLMVNSNVQASVTMDASTLSANSWCGTATGSVEKPLSLDLAGSTFAARRDDGTIAIADVPQSCFPKKGGNDGGVVDVPEPLPPDLSKVPSQLADISGHWILQAKIPGGIPLELWAELDFIAAPDGGGSLDGSLRRATDPLGSLALTSFSTTVDKDGRFQIWLPHLNVGQISASTLLVAATQDMNGFCGAGAGQVQKPLMLDLAGTTFAATRWTPGTPLPMMPPDHCP
jgi:hypothetical protein